MYKVIITNDAQRNIDQIVYGLIEYSKQKTPSFYLAFF